MRAALVYSPLQAAMDQQIRARETVHSRDAHSTLTCARRDIACRLPSQEDMEMTKDGFMERFGELPRKDDLTILAPKREDPTEQARSSIAGFPCRWWVRMHAAKRRIQL